MISPPSVSKGLQKPSWTVVQGSVHTPLHPTYRSPRAQYVPIPSPKRRTPAGLVFVGLPVPAPRARPNNRLVIQLRGGIVPQLTPSVCTGHGVGGAAWDLQSSHF